jgi:thiamine-phosphate pyrophosphorylase
MIDFTLYLITDRHQVEGGDLLAAVEEALVGGVRAVQLREKDLTDRKIYELGKEARSLTRKYGAKLWINDRADIALAVEAEGVHLRQSSYSAQDARKILGKTAIVGVSTHSLDQARRAECDGADFLTVGPVFDTPSKRSYGPPIGLDLLKEIAHSVSIPVFAIGGIQQGNVPSVLEAGAHGIALISGILASENVGTSAKNLVSLVDQLPRSRPICK